MWTQSLSRCSEWLAAPLLRQNLLTVIVSSLEIWRSVEVSEFVCSFMYVRWLQTALFYAAANLRVTIVWFQATSLFGWEEFLFFPPLNPWFPDILSFPLDLLFIFCYWFFLTIFYLFFLARLKVFLCYCSSPASEINRPWPPQSTLSKGDRTWLVWQGEKFKYFKTRCCLSTCHCMSTASVTTVLTVLQCVECNNDLNLAKLIGVDYMREVLKVTVNSLFIVCCYQL